MVEQLASINQDSKKLEKSGKQMSVETVMLNSSGEKEPRSPGTDNVLDST